MAAQAETAVFDPGKIQTAKSTLDPYGFESDNLLEASSIIQDKTDSVQRIITYRLKTATNVQEFKFDNLSN